MQSMPSEGESNLSEVGADWRRRWVSEETRGLLERDGAAFLHQRLSSPCTVAARRAEGVWIEDTDGNRYMDFHGNSVHHIGYGHPRLIEAVANQLTELPFSPRRFTNSPSVELAERLIDRAPEGFGKVLFTTGGSDAVEIALKIARAATGRFKTLSFWDSFHGAGFGAASVGGDATFRSFIAGPLLSGAEHVAPFSCYRCPYGHPGPSRCGTACAEMPAYVLGREGDIAAVIAEPMRAVPQIAPKGYWRRVRDACDAQGALLIFDEIPTGLGKTGRFFAFEHEGVVPDIFVLGKALGGGVLPIAAVLARKGLDVGAEFAIGHYTHEKNPVTARAALTVLDIIEDERLVERAQAGGEVLLKGLKAIAAGSSIVGDVRGRGLLCGLEIVRDRESRTPAPDLAETILYDCMRRGLSFKISQNCVLTLSPPLTVTGAELEQALDVLTGAVACAEAGRDPAGRAKVEGGLDSVRSTC